MQTGNVETFSLDENTWKGLTLTDSAAQQILHLVQSDDTVKGLRLSVKQSGCAGFGYVLDLVNAPDVGDLVFEREGAHLYVPLKAMPFIDDTELDYVREGLNQIFKFNNPKAQHACGCGESFGIE
ncbi:Fe-S cluster assembly scaffold SufA [Candidatus Symbiopectobacterium sp. 'North America']|uniref:Fe-S cluster assembly scaffold SufA n=1 Tax=Candidatus Symbiopectobacterium sp. 'North America' TaxID=2794574 RepID=UPI0018CB3640|nr:Fe-S cluster assembly scaffold SufA [Candidatus Symbiopectobacterium sp. 'North America']MBG6244506.1 Fe-S cluster assembly scaffold SufA [Candidatus Symbiopectobacterium sp. 'North America']